MNSVIQQLFLVPGIKEALLSIDDEDADEETLFFQFQMVMGHLQVHFSSIKFDRFNSFHYLYSLDSNPM